MLITLARTGGSLWERERLPGSDLNGAVSTLWLYQVLLPPPFGCVMSFFKRLLNRILPEDKEVGCGYGPFKLSRDHPFTPACNLHDKDFEDAHNGINERTIDEADWNLFWRMVLIAKSQTTPEKQCAMALEICLEWPLARGFGGITWDGDQKKLVGSPKEIEKIPEDTLNVIAMVTSKSTRRPPE